MATDETVVTFGIGSALFALPVAPVVEILDAREIAPLPRAPAHLLGLIDRRGASVPVVDLRRLLGQPDRDDTPDTRIVVLSLAAPGRETGGEEGAGENRAGEDGARETDVSNGAAGAATAGADPAPAGAAAGHHVGLRVDRVTEVTVLDEAGSAPLAEADLLRWNERMVSGIGRRNGAFVTVLDVGGLFAGDLRALLSAEPVA